MQIMIKNAKLLPLVNASTMAAPTKVIPKIKFGGRVLRPGQEATALTLADRSKPDYSKVELNAKLFKGEVRLNNETLEDSVEGGNLKNTIMQLMSEAVSRDVEDLIVNGDTASADTFLASLDGVLKQATSHVVDVAGGTTTKEVFTDLFKALPQEFRRDKNALRYFTSGNSEVDYRNYLAGRATNLGDANLATAADISFMGMKILDIPMFPENLGVGNNATNILLCDPKNIHAGFWRQITVETDKNISDGVVVIVVSLRMDVRFEHEPAVAKAINVVVS